MMRVIWGSGSWMTLSNLDTDRVSLNCAVSAATFHQSGHEALSQRMYGGRLWWQMSSVTRCCVKIDAAAPVRRSLHTTDSTFRPSLPCGAVHQYWFVSVEQTVCGSAWPSLTACARVALRRSMVDAVVRCALIPSYQLPPACLQDAAAAFGW